MESPDKYLHWQGFLRAVPRKQLLLTVFYGVLRIFIAAVWPYLLYHYLQRHSHSSAGQIVGVIVTVIGILILSGLASHKQSLINIAIMRNYSLQLVERMWVKMNALDWLCFHGKNRVYFFDMLMVEAWRLRQGMVALLEFIIVNSIIAAALTLFILFISWPLFVLCATGLLLTAGLQYYTGKRTRPFLKHFHEAWRAQHHWVAKAVDQFDLLKMDRGYQESAEANRQNTQTFLASNAAMLHAQSKWRTLNQVAGNMVRVIIFITGIYWVQIQLIQLTDLLLVLLIVSMIQNSLLQVPGAVANFMEGQEAAESIAAFFLLPEETRNELKADDTAPVNHIAIKGLSFSYGEKPAIDHLDITLQKGKLYLWKGTNGSGKSTTAHILLGLLTPQSGSLYINGEAATWDTLKQLRKRFAFVNQDAPLFMGTIRDNVLFGNESPEEGWNTVVQSWLAGLLPANHNTGSRPVGDRGEGLSGGEARRLALIREWIRSADVFILDEPLNHLDEHAINEIKREILNIKAEAIVIIISHQLGFENIADEIKQF